MNKRLSVTFADNGDPPPVVETCLVVNFFVASATAGMNNVTRILITDIFYASNKKKNKETTISVLVSFSGI